MRCQKMLGNNKRRLYHFGFKHLKVIPGELNLAVFCLHVFISLGVSIYRRSPYFTALNVRYRVQLSLV